MVKTVSSTPKRLQWYHWALLVLGTLVLLASIWFAYFSSFDSRSGRPLDNFGLPLMLFGIWASFLWPMIRSQVIVEYHDTSILRLRAHGQEVNGPFPFEFIQKIVKRSPTSSEITFSPASTLTVLAGESTQHRVRLENIIINGNESDLTQFHEVLAKNKVSVLEDPIPDNDPVKQVAIGLIGIVAIVVMILLVFWSMQFVK